MVTNPYWPLVVDQVAFNTGFSTGTTPSWQDLSTRVWSFGSGRGRQYELDQNMAGEAKVVFADKDEALNPSNPGSTFAPNVLLYRPYLRQAMWPPAPVGAAVNLLNSISGYDPSFDSYTTAAAVAWITAVGGTTPVVGTTTPHSGAKDLTWTVVNGATVQGVSYAVACIPGQQYTASVYVQQSSASTQQISVVGGATGTSTSTTGAYVRLTVTFTATQPTHTIQVATTGTAVAGTVLLDDIQLETGASASTWASTGPVIYGVYRGFVERWPSRWNHRGMYGYAEITAVDAFAALAANRLHTEYRNVLYSLAPDYYWALNEPQDTATFGETSGNNGPPLLLIQSKYGAGTAPQAGTTVDIVGDPGGTGVTFTPSPPAGHNSGTLAGTCLGTGPDGASNSPAISLPAVPGSPWALTMSLWFQATDNGADEQCLVESSKVIDDSFFYQPMSLFVDTTGVSVNYENHSGAALSFLAGNYLDGLPHHVVGVISQDATNTTTTIYIDNASVSNTVSTPGLAGGLLTHAGTNFMVGAEFSGASFRAPLNGTTDHVGVWNRALSAGEVNLLWQAATLAYSGETSGARVARYLAIGWGGATAIDTGQSVMGVSVLAEGTTVLEACQAVATSENGNFWADGTGTVTFTSRTRRYQTLTSALTFGELENPYEGDIGYDYDPQYIANAVTVTNSGGVVARAIDPTSVGSYGTKTFDRTINVLSDAEAVNAATWIMNTHKDPHQRIATLTINPGANPNLWPVALGTEIGDRITVTRRTPVFTMTTDYFIERIDHANSPGVWVTAFQASPLALSPIPLTLDDSTYGVLDSNPLGY